MEHSFLLSDAPIEPGHRLIRSVIRNSNPILIFVKDFENLAVLQRDFPGVIWIVVDISRNPDTINKFLTVIPTPNYVVSFAGPGSDFSQVALDALQSCGVSYKERERGHSELTLEGIVDEDDGEECKILVNVVEKRSELKIKSKSLTKKVGKLVKGAKRKLSSLTQDDDSDSAEEHEPLIHRYGSDEEPVPQECCFTALFTLCCPCFSKAPEPEYCFQSPQELRLQMHSEQLAEVRKTFKKLHETYISKWDVRLLELRRKESQKIEELVAKVDDLREQEEQELTNEKDKQNANTRDRLSNVLSADTIRRIEESRSRQTKGTSKYDADRAFREGHSLISKQVAIDKAQLHERHYFKLVEEQLQTLTNIQTKYQKKTRNLHERHFGTL